ncbi:class I SAM-dependent methyltransferase [Roseomonas sp. CCTCC AB2023176]|uniref:class I SAM-dependent methyltransferase n=1 Tax=Roseomonas sp. CCTCC AB2023176 TaxID=3342640 RepID=UPI0035DEE91C
MLAAVSGARTPKDEEDRLYADPDLASFYDLDNQWRPSLDVCRRLARGRARVLDLGCGTGLFAATLAGGEGLTVCGVDPAGPMLDIARRRPGGDRVAWVQGDARTVRLERPFDLVVLTGHAFQVFLTREDRSAVLRTIAAHLAPDGVFAFDTRNPDLEAWRRWTPDDLRVLHHPVFGAVRAWNDVSQDPATGVVTYESFYKVVADGRTLRSASRIAFPARAEVADAIEAAGLVAESWMGDWHGAPLSPEAPEIIPIGGWPCPARRT